MPERNCAACKRQVEWGCTAKRLRNPAPGEPDGPENWSNPSHLPVGVNGGESYACPRQVVKESPSEWSRLLLLYGMYLKGHLPERGAIIDQSNSLLESFRVLDEANADCDRIVDERNRAPRGRPGG